MGVYFVKESLLMHMHSNLVECLVRILLVGEWWWENMSDLNETDLSFPGEKGWLYSNKGLG